MTEPLTGRIEALFLARERETPVTPVAEAVALAGRGLDGDRHALRAPDGPRQILLVDAAELAHLKLPPGALKENVLIAGLPLESFEAGQRLRLGESVVIEIAMTCVPCQKLERIRPGLLKQSWGRRGQLAKVIEGGLLREGDPVVLAGVNPEAPRKIKPKLPSVPTLPG